MTAYLQQLFQFGTYKSRQGRLARNATFIALAVIAAAGCYTLYLWMDAYTASAVKEADFAEKGPEAYAAAVESSKAWAEGVRRAAAPVAAGLFAVLAWAAFRLIQLPKFAEFLISVEQEMNKVSWPGKSQLFKASLVVILTIFVLAAVLFIYDLLWKWLFDKLL